MFRIASWIAVAGLTCAALGQDSQPSAKPKDDKAEPKKEAQAEPAPKGDGLHPLAKMETSLGDILIELDAEKAPITVLNFVQYAQDDYYSGTIFHRVKSNFMIQGGGFTAEMDEKKAGLRAGIKNEWQTGLKNVRGTIAMARRGWQPGMPPAAREEAVNSATSQFFINVVDNPMLDQAQADGAAYTGFGKVVGGMDVVDKIKSTAVQNHPKYPSGEGPVVPTTPIVIKKVTVTGFDKAKAQAQIAKADETVKTAAEAARAQRDKELADAVAQVEKETGKKIEKSSTGLMWVVVKEGTGPTPKITDTVEVNYTGTFLNGKQFDSSVGPGKKPLVHPVNRFMAGWTEALQDMKVGEKRILLIPSKIAYGEEGYGALIPPNSNLKFEMELLGIK